MSSSASSDSSFFASSPEVVEGHGLSGSPSPCMAHKAPDVDTVQGLCKQARPKRFGIYTSCFVRALILSAVQSLHCRAECCHRSAQGEAEAMVQVSAGLPLLGAVRSQDEVGASPQQGLSFLERGRAPWWLKRKGSFYVQW